MMDHNKQSLAFSLVELSIVLVILGLLAGGILAGQSLIRAAELRSVASDYTKYQTATRAFRDKYFTIPGDMNNATSLWGSLGGTGADINCAIIVSTGTATCNGNGDGSLMDYQGQGGTLSQENERFWQHLANAGLIDGRYPGGSPGLVVYGNNVPSSRLGSGTYFLARVPFSYTGGSTYYSGDPYLFPGDYGRGMYALTNGGDPNTAGSLVLKPEDAWNIDSKLDDGKPGSGVILAYKGMGGAKTNCTDKANAFPPADAGASYLLSNINKDCELYFIRAF